MEIKKRLSKLNKEELTSLARKLDLTGYKRLKKGALINIIIAKGSEQEVVLALGGFDPVSVDSEEEKKCTHITTVLRICCRDLYDKEHCVFHSKDIEGKKDKFNAAFWKEFERQKEQEEFYDFKGFIFPGKISFEKKIFEKSAFFEDAEFFESAFFMGTRFNELAYFESAKFTKVANFKDAKFTKVAYFLSAQFSKVAYFEDAKFSENAYFGYAKFFDYTYFGSAQFSGLANFWYTHYYRRAYFRSAQFSEKADFKSAQFSGEADFSSAHILGEADFRSAQFSGKANFSSAQIPGEADFSSAQFSGEADFYKVKFKEEANFENITLSKYNSFKMIDTYFYDVSGLFEFIEANKKKIKYSNKTEFLPENFRLILGEAATARYPVISRKIRDDMYLLSFKKKHPKMHFIWWLFADCGRSFFQWALWSLGFVLFFALNFYLIDYAYPTAFHFNDAIQEITFWSYVYYSVVTFTTLGFGDIIPTMEWVQRWVMAEVITGYIMLGGLISILANKLARRS